MKFFLLVAVINGFLAVALGAFGAHGLDGKIPEKALKAWEKAVNYQMFHTVALFIIGLLLTKYQGTNFATAGWFFLAGIILFSGSLYIYAPTGIKTFAMITPLGGVAFLIGWVVLGYAIMKFI
ncbi:DUF423 domain-containing protein [Aquibacillus salsiterrae]|uniref:DUF423 domain-containing protein n=1 Tax=Aquibacillus salsiterrae TaxID=2950439 RepID=A0A9X4AG17_9BACI|nr:DUF423 domain-containing protein [Aquibacillus salsiterrae]MDC3416815.1 DUF423 domain-containing protein [Aquibacillus salsiterrae]